MKRKDSNINLKITAVILAVLLWLVVVNVNNPVEKRVFYDIPVEITHDELITNQGKTYQVKEESNNVSVTLQARRSILDAIRNKDIVATADVRNIELGELLPIKISVVGYDGRISQAQASPNNVQIRQEQSISSRFPIQVETDGAIRDGFILKSAEASPASIKVMGPKSLVGRIDKVVAKINVSGMAQNTTKKADLVFYDGGGTILDVSSLTSNLGTKPGEKMQVNVDIGVIPSKVVSIKIDDSLIETKRGYKIGEIASEPKEIRVAGRKDLLSALKYIEIPAEALVMHNVATKTDKTIDISEYMPKGIVLADEKEKNVVVLIVPERLGMKTFNIPISAIKKKNLEKDMKAEITGSQEIAVDFTGEDADLEKLKEEDVQEAIYIDLAGQAREGTYSVPVKVDLPHCSLAEDVNVNVKLTK